MTNMNSKVRNLPLNFGVYTLNPLALSLGDIFVNLRIITFNTGMLISRARTVQELKRFRWDSF